MAIKNQSVTVQYLAWDANTNAGKTGDVANHTLRIVTDGVALVPSNAASEIDSTNLPGLYKITLTAAEMNGNIVTLHGKSSSAGVSIIPVQITTERGILPSAFPGNFATMTITSAGRMDVGLWMGVQPNALISNRVDVNVQAMAAAVITSSTIAASTFASSHGRDIADEMLNRNLAGGGSGGARIVRDAFRLLRNKWSIGGGTLTVTAEDDTTSAWTAAVSTTASNPITTVDPA